MVNGSRYYRALESVSIAHSFICQTVAVIYPCHIRFHQTLHDSQLQLLTARKNWSGGRPQRTVYPRRLPVNTVNTHYVSSLAGIELTTFRLLVRRATSSATDSPNFLFFPLRADMFRLNLFFGIGGQIRRQIY